MTADSDSKTTPAVRRRGPKGEQRRREILDVAKEILLREGWNQLSLRDVAVRVGITHGNLQYYFRTKQHLIIAIYDEELARFTEGLEQAVSSASTVRGRLEAIVDSAFDAMKFPDVALWFVAISMAPHSEEMASLLQRDNELYRDAVATELARIVPEMSPLRRGHLARMIQAFIDGAAIQLATEAFPETEKQALRREIKSAVETLVRAE